MEKNKTLKEVYKNSSEEVKEILKTKFSETDLGIIYVEQQIRNKILEIIKKNIRNIRFLDEDGNKSDLPTPRFEILDVSGNWLFDINYDEKNKHFWYSYLRIYEIFESEYNINYLDFNEVMRGVVGGDLKMGEVTPSLLPVGITNYVGGDLKMGEVTPKLGDSQDYLPWGGI